MEGTLETTSTEAQSTLAGAAPLLLQELVSVWLYLRTLTFTARPRIATPTRRAETGDTALLRFLDQTARWGETYQGVESAITLASPPTGARLDAINNVPLNSAENIALHGNLLERLRVDFCLCRAGEGDES